MAPCPGCLALSLLRCSKGRDHPLPGQRIADTERAATEPSKGDAAELFTEPRESC